jgi:hypothetical protein
MSIRQDLVGRLFGKLTVIKKSDKRDKHRNIFWECLCSCGNTTFVVSRDLLNGHTKSCKCFQKSAIKDVHKKYRQTKNVNPNIPMSNQARLIRWEVDKVKKLIKTRDFNICVLCHACFEPLHIHHIISIFENPSLAIELTNLVCLCRECHKLAHPLGSKSTDREIQAKLFTYIESIQNEL